MQDIKLYQSVQSLSHVLLFATPWTAALQASLSITNSRSPSKSMSIESAKKIFRIFKQGKLLVQLSRSDVSDSLCPRGLQYTRPPWPSPTPGDYSSSCLPSQQYNPTISSSVVPFSSHLQSFPASGSFPMSQFYASGDQSIGVIYL